MLAGPIGAFESETQDVIRRTSPYSEHAILHAVVAMLLLAVLLMSVVRVDRVVVASGGRILPTSGSFFVQAAGQGDGEQPSTSTRATWCTRARFWPTSIRPSPPPTSSS